MERFVQKSAPEAYVAIATAMAGVFVADVVTPLGVAVWVIYLIPVSLTLLVWKPGVPIITAIIATGLMVYSLFNDSVGAYSKVGAATNRGMGIATIWITAAICRQVILTKLAVRKQEWLQIGQTRLSEQMAGELDIHTLGQKILRFLCEYTEARVGAAYALSGERLHREAAYAVPQETDLPEYISAGQGLVGQAFADRRPLIVRAVPEGYMQFGSALGRGRPSHLLIFPVSVDDAVNGVIELGFATNFRQSDVDLLTRVGESIAIAIRSAQYRMRLRHLLDETQRQSAELQAQSEELRVNNEELEEQSRALKESQSRLELQQAELEQTNSQLEEQTRHLEQQREDLARSKAAVENQAEELARASRYKSEFLANMSHELRTPLNSSLILAKLLQENRDGNLTQEQTKFAQTIYDAGNDLLTLINDILDLSKIEAGRLDVRPSHVRVKSLVQSIRNLFEPVAKQKGLQFQTNIDSSVPDSILTDAQRVEQILRNLLSNAMKFTDAGSVSLQIRSSPEGRIEFAVHDTGIGIGDDQRDVIFEAFRQADGTTNRKYGGTGLGLSIGRELARLLGGDIHLSSAIGRGSTFVLTLPVEYDETLKPAPTIDAFRPSPTSSAQTPSALPNRALTRIDPERKGLARVASVLEDDRGELTGNARVILAIEDDVNFARILYDLARELDFRCLLATTAEEGLALAAQHSPSAILLDIGLPDQSGLSVLDRLKRDVRTRHVPVHVLSANDYSETAFSLGAIGYMLKPVKREELVQTFQRLESRLAKRMRRVLIVEDDTAQLESLRHLLGSREVDTIGASSAAECLELLKNTTFDCMVLDLALPDSSGFALLETLSREDRYSFPPVIVYTGRDLSSEEEQKLRRYSTSIIIKGAKSPERLLDEVTLFLHQIVAELPEEQQEMLKKAQSREAALEGRRILIVEDDVRNIFALTSVLEPKGALLTIARNGREALDVLDRAEKDPAGRIDLVLMDLMMPEMDGLTATREIRKRPAWAKLPVIALTAKAMRSDQQQCLEAGATDYMAKPLDVEKLLSLIRVWLPR